MQSDTGEMSNLPTSNTQPKSQNEWGPYDETFVVKKQRWGTHVSYSLTDNQPLITSLTLEGCIAATRFYLKGQQEGWEGHQSRSYEGTVGGKL